MRRDPSTDDVILSRRPDSWQDFFDLVDRLDIPEDFMSNRDTSPPQKRKLFYMPIRYLLDTNVASYVVKKNVPHVRENLRRVPMAEVGILVVTEAELRYGLTCKPQARLKLAVQKFLLRVEILAWDSPAARHYAVLRSAMEDSGTRMATST